MFVRGDSSDTTAIGPQRPEHTGLLWVPGWNVNNGHAGSTFQQRRVRFISPGQRIHKYSDFKYGIRVADLVVICIVCVCYNLFP